MEKLQGPINPCHVDERCLEEQNPAQGLACYAQLLTSEAEDGEEVEAFRFEEYTDEQQQLQLQLQHHQTPQYTLPRSILEDKMPFLQMLQSVDCTAFLHEPNFQLLLRLQDQDQKKTPPWNTSYELDSCVTNAIVEGVHETMDFNLSSECRNQMQEEQTLTTYPSSTAKSKQTQMADDKPPASLSAKEKRKRKRSKLTKNKQEVETQRMTHIAVERNRRRQMNEHLNALRSLMPSSYIQRGDQASIIGGAIDFVKELEQMLRSLQAQKRMRHSEDSNGDVSTGSTSTSSSNLQLNNNNNNIFMSSPSSQLLPPDNDGSSSADLEAAGVRKGDDFTAENRSPEADVDVVVIHNHVNLKIQCQRRPGQLIRAILALEDLRLTVLHLNITSLENLIHYSFNLKIEDDCNLRSAAEIAGAVHQLFSHSCNLEN
ncbi:hypothetical protein V2J09_024340 [Rumex salicifolius]